LNTAHKSYEPIWGYMFILELIIFKTEDRIFKMIQISWLEQHDGDYKAHSFTSTSVSLVSASWHNITSSCRIIWWLRLYGSGAFIMC